VGITEWIKDRWLTWRTGKSKEQREWEAWYEINVVYRASSITNMFQHFKHVIIVDPDKFFDHCEPFAYVPNEDARQYFWPQRPLGNNAVWRFERVMWDKRANTWYISGLGDTDMIFVATNNDDDAVMVSLKFT
jgi:hypothetical protein